MLKFISKALQSTIHQKSVVALLEKRISGFKARRKYSNIHMSMLTDIEYPFCAREVALLEKHKVERKERWTPAAMQIAFDHGNALADLVRNVWLREDVVGKWRCKACRHHTAFGKVPTDKCGCGADLWEYTEEEFVDPETKTTGSIDFFVDLGTGKHVSVECKSIDKDQFIDLKAPLAEHRVRTVAYLSLIARSKKSIVGRLDTSHARVLYVSKGYGKKHDELGTVLPFKEYIVTRNDDATAPYFEAALAVRKWREIRQMPERICVLPTDKRAKKCQMKKECFE